MKNWLLTGLLFMIVSTAFSQSKITGTITDGALSLPGANAVVKGSSDAGSSDFDGKFTITTSVTSGEIVVSYLGYESKTISFSVAKGGTVNLGVITLNSNSNELSEIVVKSGVVDIAKDRKTPVAVSTIKAAEIQAKLGTQEFPEILKNTPSVYATKSGGGFGDSRINIRGFDQKNIAVMINGVPVNDMEGGTVYWSNWAGLSDVTSAMQVQRGLGSSKLAIASVGGTINVLTKTSDMKEGGTISSGFGNAQYFKVQASYNTGVMKNGLSASVLLSSTVGDGYIDGTQFEGKNYYIAFGYKPNDKHDIQFTFTGAPQWHNQRNTFITLDTYLKYGSNGDPNTRYNSDWGYLNGEAYNIRKNYYSKPVGSINWDWNINETTKLSTVVYGSWGRGAGTNGTGGIRGNNYAASALRTADGLVDYDKIQQWNSGQPITLGTTSYQRTPVAGEYPYVNGVDTGRSGANTPTSPYVYNTTSGISQISSFNSHNWYGGIVSMNKKLTETLTLDLGVDLRTYKGIHYQTLNNLYGASAFLDKTDVNNPNRILTQIYPTKASLNPFAKATAEEKLGYDYDGNVNWYGAFTQLEYSKDNLTAFIQGAISQQGFKRTDRFNYTPDNPLYETDYENILGGNVKGGANYNINEQHNVFFNTGYYSKQPFFTAVYPNFRNILNGNLTNEKIFGLEAGYGFRSSIVNANVNVYRTSWKDRYLRNNDGSGNNPGGYIDYSGISEIHSGIELEANAKVTDKLKINAMFSVGDWKYDGNSISNTYDAANNVVPGTANTVLYLDGVKVGDAAQLTASLGAAYEVVRGLTVDANYNYYDKLYSTIAPLNFTKEDNRGSLQLPDYGLVDAGLSYRLPVGKKKDNSVNFRFNVNNVFDEIYIAEGKTNFFAEDFPTQATYKGISTNNQVYFGFGRTWNMTLSYNF